MDFQGKLNIDLEKVMNSVTVSENEMQEETSQLQWALNQLEDSDKELLVLNRLCEIRYNELSEILGSSPGALKTKVSRALKKLKEIYFQNTQQ